MSFYCVVTFQADAMFDDSYARKVCGSETIPTNKVIVFLCMEMMELGKWYTTELEKIGLYEPGVEVKIEPSNPKYQEVREIGVEVDIIAQELMVMMAREDCIGLEDGERDEDQGAHCDQEHVKRKEYFFYCLSSRLL